MAHMIEVSKSGRASCRGCKENIAKGDLRFGEEFANQFSDSGGMSYRYWHLKCAAKKLANELKGVLTGYEGEVPDRAEIDKLVLENMRPEFPYAEHAASGRAKCRVCDTTIAKGELRIAFERVYDTGMGQQKSAAYVHPKCMPGYVESETDIGMTTAEALLKVITNSTKLSEADRDIIRAAAK